MSLAEGTRVYICYDLPPPELWHERLVLASCACGRGWHIVLTPDFDVFPEHISLENDDISGFRVGRALQLPAGLDDSNTYRFRNMPAGEEMTQMRLDAQHAAAALAFPPGAGPGLAAPPAAAPAGAPASAASTGGKWVCIESTEHHLRGDVVALDGSEIVQGDLALKPDGGSWIAIRRMGDDDISKYKGKEAAADARLLGISFQGLQRDERLWRDVSKETHAEEFADWNVPGPRTAAWCVRFLNRRNGGPMDHHRWWMTNHGLQADAWGATEHENLMKILDRLGRFDGLDLSNLAGAELAFRRLQLIEYFYSDRGPGGGKGSGKNKEKKVDEAYKAEAAVFTGTHREFGDTMVAPELLDYVSKEVEKDASVMKQVRKAREERAAASK